MQNNPSYHNTIPKNNKREPKKIEEFPWISAEIYFSVMHRIFLGYNLVKKGCFWTMNSMVV